jgi:hypothetical protein
MAQDEAQVIRAVIRALDVPRNRYGRLIVDMIAQEPLRQEAVNRLAVGHRGHADVVEQAVAVLRTLIDA